MDWSLNMWGEYFLKYNFAPPHGAFCSAPNSPPPFFGAWVPKQFHARGWFFRPGGICGVDQKWFYFRKPLPPGGFSAQIKYFRPVFPPGFRSPTGRGEGQTGKVGEIDPLLCPIILTYSDINLYASTLYRQENKDRKQQQPRMGTARRTARMWIRFTTHMDINHLYVQVPNKHFYGQSVFGQVTIITTTTNRTYAATAATYMYHLWRHNATNPPP